MSCKNRTNNCCCKPTSPCDEAKNYCCMCYSHQWYNAPRYSECSKRVKVNDISDGCGCGCTTETVAQDNFSFASCGCENDNSTQFSELDEIYWQ